MMENSISLHVRMKRRSVIFFNMFNVAGTRVGNQDLILIVTGAATGACLAAYMVVRFLAAAAGGMEGQSHKIWMKISMIHFQFQKMTWGHVRS